jgi:hypothetical protein
VPRTSCCINSTENHLHRLSEQIPTLRFCQRETSNPSRGVSNVRVVPLVAIRALDVAQIFEQILGPQSKIAHETHSHMGNISRTEYHVSAGTAQICQKRPSSSLFLTLWGCFLWVSETPTSFHNVCASAPLLIPCVR